MLSFSFNFLKRYLTLINLVSFLGSYFISSFSYIFEKESNMLSSLSNLYCCSYKSEISTPSSTFSFINDIYLSSSHYHLQN